MQQIVFDSSAILTWYKLQNNFETIDSYLKKVNNSEIEGYICEINLAEILYQIARLEDDFEIGLEFINDLINQVGLKKIDTDWSILKQAAKYKVAGNIALPDCILLATAINFEASILTCDKEFKPYEKEASIIWF